MNCPLSPPVLSDYNAFTDTRFSQGTPRLMSWPDREHYSFPPQFLVVSLPLFLVSTLAFLIEIFQHTGSLDFHSGIVLPRHARCVLSSLRCNGHGLLLSSYPLGLTELIILHAAPADTSHLILHCPETHSLHRLLFGDSCLSTTSGLGPGELPGF